MKMTGIMQFVAAAGLFLGSAALWAGPVAPTASVPADTEINPFTGRTASYEDMLRENDRAGMELNITKKQLEIARTRAEIGLIPFKMKQEMKKLQAPVAPAGFPTQALAMPTVAPMPAPAIRPHHRHVMKRHIKPYAERLPAAAMIPPPVPAGPNLEAVIAEGHQNVAIVSANGQSFAVHSGDSIPGYRVTAVDEERVVLQGMAGERVLHLQRRIGTIAYRAPVPEVKPGASGSGDTPPSTRQMEQSLLPPPGFRPINGPLRVGPGVKMPFGS